LQRMAAPLNDGHMFVSLYQNKDVNNLASAPIVITKVENQLLVKFVLDTALHKTLHSGDVIKSINCVPALNYLTDKEKLISGSPQWKEAKALFTIANGDPSKKFQLVVHRNKRDINLTVPFDQQPVDYRPGSFSPRPRATGWIKPGIFYLNLSIDSITNYIPNLLKAKAIIFDVRGYPKQESFKLISMLLRKNDNTDWAYFPQILFPDFEKVQYSKNGWHLKPDSLHINAKVFFLADATAISAAESLLGYVKDFKLGTIVGQPSAGTNGNINYIYLLGDYSMGFSGMVIKNHDGTKNHLIGILPDVQVNITKAQVINQEDGQLKKATEMAKTYVNGQR